MHSEHCRTSRMCLIYCWTHLHVLKRSVNGEMKTVVALFLFTRISPEVDGPRESKVSRSSKCSGYRYLTHASWSNQRSRRETGIVQRFLSS